MPTQQSDTPGVKPDEREDCAHPESERFTHDFGQGGYLNTPKGERILCAGCGTDLTDELDDPAGHVRLAHGMDPSAAYWLGYARQATEDAREGANDR